MILQHQGESAVAPPKRRAGQLHGAARRRPQTGDGEQERRLPAPGRADEALRTARRDLQALDFNDWRAAVAGGQVMDVEHLSP